MTAPVPPRPAIRARWTQMVLDGIDVRLSDVQLANVRPRLDPEIIAAIRAKDGLDWLDIEQHVHVLEALYWGLGKADFVAFCRESARRIFRSRFLRTIVVAGARVFGRRALVRALPGGWNFVLRDCGVLHVDRDDGSGITDITLSDIPANVARSDAIRLATAAAIAATMDVGGYLGRVEVDPGPVRDRTFEFRASLVVDPT